MEGPGYYSRWFGLDPVDKEIILKVVKLCNHVTRYAF